MITFRIKPKIRHNRNAITRKWPELMNPWNPIGRKVAGEAAVAATEITRRGEVRRHHRQHRHGNDSGQKAQHRMGSFVASAPGQHCKFTKITPAAKAAGEAVTGTRPATSGPKLRSWSPCVEHAFVDFCGGEVNFPASEPGQHIAGVSIVARTLSARRRYLATAVTLSELASETFSRPTTRPRNMTAGRLSLEPA
jgi:hypothetical protein